MKNYLNYSFEGNFVHFKSYQGTFGISDVSNMAFQPMFDEMQERHGQINSFMIMCLAKGQMHALTSEE